MSAAPTAAREEWEIGLFEEALSLPPADRHAFLKEACADSEVMENVMARLAREERMNGFMLTPVLSWMQADRPFSPGDVVAGRFEIVREVAEGGMAVVYEALDRKLGMAVALKCPKLPFRRRLPEELRNALQVTHRNICRFHEVHTAATSNGPLEFLTMEFLDGETLAERLSRGPLPHAEALKYAVQISAGLGEAHSRNVVHGDLKPGNVILARTEEGGTRAVITDFGLACVSQETSGTEVGESLRGTPGYVAPERWRGQPAKKTSDVFALGVMLYEMLLGSIPQADPRAEEMAPVPQAWRAVLAACLASDPDVRPRDGPAVAGLLPRPRVHRGWQVASLAAVAAAAAVVVRLVNVGPAVPDVVRLAILAADTDAASSVIGTGAGYDLSERLQAGQGATKPTVIIPLEKAVRYHVASADTAAKVFGATHSLVLRWRAQDGKFALEGSIDDAPTGRQVRGFRRVFQRNELNGFPRQVASEISSALGREVTAEPFGGAPGSYSDYAEGMYSMRQALEPGRAIAAFERSARAAGADPMSELHLAAAELAESGGSTRPEQLARATGLLEKVGPAARRERASNLLLASVEASAGLPEAALGDYRTETLRMPAGGAAWRGLATVLQGLGREEEAEAAWRSAIQAEPGYFQPRMDLGVFYYVRGRYADARDQFSVVTRAAPRLAQAHHNLAVTLVDLGDYARAEPEYQQALSIEQDPDTLIGIGALLAYQKRHAESVYYYERAVAAGPEHPLNISNLGDAYRRTGRAEDAGRTYSRVLEVAGRWLGSNPADASTRSIYAYALARLGRRTQALREIGTSLHYAKEIKVRKRAVLTYEILGMRPAAFELLAGAPAAMLLELSRYPDLADFAASRRFTDISRIALSSRKE